MNSIRVNPTMKLVNERWWNGLNHSALGVRWPGGALPLPTFTRATTAEQEEHCQFDPEEKIFCRKAEISMPM